MFVCCIFPAVAVIMAGRQCSSVIVVVGSMHVISSAVTVIWKWRSISISELKSGGRSKRDSVGSFSIAQTEEDVDSARGVWKIVICRFLYMCIVGRREFIDVEYCRDVIFRDRVSREFSSSRSGIW